MTGRYDEIVKQVTAVKEQRGAMYRVEPKDIVPIEVLEAVALLKAYRGYEGLSIEKKIDEYTDLMNYSAFIIERLQDEQKQERLQAKHVDIGSYGTSSQQTTKVIQGKCNCNDSGFHQCNCSEVNIVDDINETNCNN